MNYPSIFIKQKKKIMDFYNDFSSSFLAYNIP